MASTALRRPFQPYGEQAWRTLVKASDQLTFTDVARLADISYARVIRMSKGEVETTPEVWDALAKLTGHSAEDLREATAIRMQLVAEDGDQS